MLPGLRIIYNASGMLYKWEESFACVLYRDFNNIFLSPIIIIEGGMSWFTCPSESLIFVPRISMLLAITCYLSMHSI